MNNAIIFAGGTGTRMGVNDVPKQFLEIDGKPVIIYTLEHFQNHPQIDGIFVVCIETWIDYLIYQLKKHRIDKVKSIVPGGITGQHSIYNGLVEAKKYGNEQDIVLIHDGVRPFITEDLISSNIRDTEMFGNSITCTKCNETFVMSKNGLDVDDIPIRRESYNAQAPQAFRLGDIFNAHNEMRVNNPDYVDVVDSCTLYNMLGRKIHLTEGIRGNIKITNPVDLYIFEAWLSFERNNKKAKGIPDLHEYYEASNV